VAWLDEVKEDEAIFLLEICLIFGSEYKSVVPKGLFVVGKIAEIRDSGISYFFVGNHDLWMEDYFQKN
jgi:UDP-2,3-diacylglucosamine hydrolase